MIRFPHGPVLHHELWYEEISRSETYKSSS
jgi:hypothetical protein